MPATIDGPGIFESPDQLPKPEASPTAIDMDTLRQFLKKEADKKQLKTQLSQIETELDQLEGTISTMLLGAGVDSMKVDGRLIYLANDLFVSPAEGLDKSDVIAQLKASEDASVFVSENYNSNSLRAWVREIADQVQETCRSAGELFDEGKVLEALPDGLKKVLAIKFGKAVRTRKA